MPSWQIVLADVGQFSVNIRHDHPFNGRVTKDLPEGSSCSPTDHKDGLWTGMAEKSGMDEHFMIDELVLLTGLPDPVQKEHPSVDSRIDNIDLLVMCSPAVDQLIAKVRHLQPFRKGLSKPERGTPGLLSHCQHPFANGEMATGKEMRFPS